MDRESDTPVRGEGCESLTPVAIGQPRLLVVESDRRHDQREQNTPVRLFGASGLPRLWIMS
jgi:hypothetical protein